MTFVQWKNRAFLDRSFLRPLRRRSESRLKTYPSAIDLRTWCDTVEERRQHIVEHITKDIEKCFGKLVPIEAIISALTESRGANCEAITTCFNQLLQFVNNLTLSEEDAWRLQNLKIQMDKSCGVGSGDGTAGLEDEEKSFFRTFAGPQDTEYGLVSNAGKMVPVSRKARASFTSDECDPDCKAKLRHDKERASIEDLLEKSSRLPSGEKGSIVTTYKGPGKQTTRIRGISPGFVVGPPQEEPGNITIKAQGPSKIKTKITNAKPRMGYYSAPEYTEGMPKSKSDSACERLRDKLAATEALCQEQQIKLADLQKERDDLRQKLGECMRELENFKKLNTVANPELPKSCQEEMEALEAEIKIMRSGNPSPEQEGEIIKKEIDMLKTYCSKLKQVEDENLKLKTQLSVSKGVGDQGLMDDIKDKLNNLEKLEKERDALANKVHMLEQKLKQYEDLPSEVEELRNRSQMLDTVIKERDEMNTKCKAMKDIEREIAKLKAKADRADELERELRSYSKFDRSSGTELKRTQSICGCLENELKNVKSEKEAMNRRIENMRKELDSNRRKIKENEILRLERDRLQIQLNQLHGIQEERDHYKAKYDEIIEMECKCEMLKRQLEEANSVSRERDHLKKQVEDLESCICAQENEIRNLIIQVDSVSRNSNADMEHLLNTMKNELKCSNDKLQSERSKIEQSEIMLQKAEHTLRQKECHIKCLEQQIRNSKKLNKEELEHVECMCHELDVAKAENKKLQDIANRMTSLTGDQQVKKMLQQSECTAKRLVEELGKQYKTWDNAKQRNYKNNKIKTSPCNCQSTDESDCEKLRKDLESLEKEKYELQKNIKQMQGPGDRKCRC